jgi:hypothetical protein
MAEVDVESLPLKTPNEFELMLEPKREIPRALKSALIDASCATDRPHDSTVQSTAEKLLPPVNAPLIEAVVPPIKEPVTERSEISTAVSRTER